MTTIKEALYAPFDNIKQRQGRGGKYDYVSWKDIADRMNEVFGTRWSSQAITCDKYDNLIITKVQVRITADDGLLYTQEGFGGALIVDKEDPGTAWKSSYSKAFKDACKKWGVGLYLEEDDQQQQDRSNPYPQDNRSYNSSSNSGPNNYYNESGTNYNTRNLPPGQGGGAGQSGIGGNGQSGTGGNGQSGTGGGSYGPGPSGPNTAGTYNNSPYGNSNNNNYRPNNQDSNTAPPSTMDRTPPIPLGNSQGNYSGPASGPNMGPSNYNSPNQNMGPGNNMNQGPNSSGMSKENESGTITIVQETAILKMLQIHGLPTEPDDVDAWIAQVAMDPSNNIRNNPTPKFKQLSYNEAVSLIGFIKRSN